MIKFACLKVCTPRKKSEITSLTEQQTKTFSATTPPVSYGPPIYHLLL